MNCNLVLIIIGVSDIDPTSRIEKALYYYKMCAQKPHNILLVYGIENDKDINASEVVLQKLKCN